MWKRLHRALYNAFNNNNNKYKMIEIETFENV